MKNDIWRNGDENSLADKNISFTNILDKAYFHCLLEKLYHP